MNTVTYKDYNNDLIKFCQKHSKHELRVYTSPFIDNQYIKSWYYSDGSEFHEVNQNVTEVVTVPVEIHGIKLDKTFEIKLVKHEYWSSDNSVSKYWYEKL